MPKLKPGSEIEISCDVQPGPFSEEKLVSFETADGTIRGFVRLSELKQKNGNEWFLRALVLKVKKDVIEVRVHGSFFTTNGLANIRRDMALAA